jgi:hypothetical protein
MPERQKQQQQQLLVELRTARVGDGTAGNSTASVSDRLAVLRMRDAGAASPPSAAQRAPADCGLLHVVENGASDHAADWRAKLMEAMAHEKQQCSEHDGVRDTAVDVTDEGWLPT